MSRVAVLSESYVGPSAAARRLGLSASRVRQLVAEGKLPAVVTPLGRLLRIDDVDGLAERRAEGTGGGKAGGGADG